MAKRVKNKNKKFYKKPKQIERNKQLPSNSRSITEKLINDHTVFLVGILVIVIATIVVGIEFFNNLRMQQKIYNDRQVVISDLNFWNKQVVEKPNYRDGYFNLALIYYQLGDKRNSQINLEKALIFDPNFEQGRELMKILEKE